MAKVLWILRHAKALEEPPPGGSDRDRLLAPRGEREADGLGEALRSHYLDVAAPTSVVTSPAARTRATAERVFGNLTPSIPISLEHRLYSATPDDALEIISEFPEDMDVVALVGHNPTVQILSLDLVKEESGDDAHPGSLRYPPGTLSIVSLPISSWSDIYWGLGTLELFVQPERSKGSP